MLTKAEPNEAPPDMQKSLFKGITDKIKTGGKGLLKNFKGILPGASKVSLYFVLFGKVPPDRNF